MDELTAEAVNSAKGKAGMAQRNVEARKRENRQPLATIVVVGVSGIVQLPQSFMVIRLDRSALAAPAACSNRIGSSALAVSFSLQRTISLMPGSSPIAGSACFSRLHGVECP